MTSLLQLFLKIIFKVTAIFAVVSLISILALDKLFGGYEFYLGMLVFIAPLVAWGVTFTLVPKNLEWILALPISKRNVLFLHYLTSVTSSVLISIASFFVLIVVALLKHETLVTVQQISKAAPAEALKAELGTMFTTIDIYGFMTILLMLSFFHALSMSVSRPASAKRLYLNLWNHNVKAIRWFVRLGWIVVLAVGAVFREFVLAPFGVFVIGTVVFLFLTTFNTTNALGMPKGQGRRWLMFSGSLAMAQLAVMFVYAWQGVHSPSFDRRVGSVIFLGPFSGGLEKRDLAKLLEEPLSLDKIKELGSLYKEKYHEKRKISFAQERNLGSEIRFNEVINSKRSYAEVLAAMHLFEVAEMGKAELDVFLAKLQTTLPECHCEYTGLDLLNVKLSAVEAASYLGSSLETANAFALSWVKYNPIARGAFIESISKNVSRYPDRTKLQALKTLSVLQGEKLSLIDLFGAKGLARRSLSSLREFDCKATPVAALHELKEEHMGWVNACLRSRADTGFAAEIEAMGWFSYPLDAREAALMRKIFRLR